MEFKRIDDHRPGVGIGGEPPYEVPKVEILHSAVGTETLECSEVEEGAALVYGEFGVVFETGDDSLRVVFGEFGKELCLGYRVGGGAVCGPFEFFELEVVEFGGESLGGGG